MVACHIIAVDCSDTPDGRRAGSPAKRPESWAQPLTLAGVPNLYGFHDIWVNLAPWFKN
jgi:hypothetical protein